jgi:hypothetical protein
MFREYIKPPPSRLKSKPSEKATEPGGKLVKVITANIPEKRMARRLEGNIWRHAAVGRVTARG